MSRNTTQSKKNNIESEVETEVLYQKLGDRWFAFSVINDEVFVGSVTAEEIQEAEKARKTRKTKSNRVPSGSA